MKIARGRTAAQTGSFFDNAHTVLIGDTPNDVKAALAAGVRIIAVASGKSSADELRAAGAEQLIADLGGLASQDGQVFAETAGT